MRPGDTIGASRVNGCLKLGEALWFTGAAESPLHRLAVAPTFTPAEPGVVVFGWF